MSAPKRIQLEPAVVRGVVVAAVTLAGSVGLLAADVDETVVDAVVVLIVTLAPIVAGLWIRPAVTTNANVVARLDRSSELAVAGDAALEPTGSVLPIASDGSVAVVPVVSEDPPVAA